MDASYARDAGGHRDASDGRDAATDAKPSRETLANQVVDTFQMLTFMLGEALGRQLPRDIWELTQQRTEQIVDAIESGDEAGISNMLLSLSALVDACHVAVEDWESDDLEYLRTLARRQADRRAG